MLPEMNPITVRVEKKGNFRPGRLLDVLGILERLLAP